MFSKEKHGIDWSQSEPQGLSHRARAFVKLAKGCLAQIPGASAAAGRR
jgi:XTP/dITP diphosphohydrolase